MSELVQKTCPICGVNYGLDPTFDTHRKNGATGDDGRPMGWHCPNGHSLIYRESEADKLRRERDLLKQREAMLLDEKRVQFECAMKAEKQVRSLKKRASAGTCPCCNRTFSNMAEHMKHQHPELIREGGAKVVPIKRAASH